MTTPKVATFHRSGSRYYIHPETGDKVPGVTSVLNMLPKPFLKAWAAKMVATEAVEGIEALTALASRDPAAAIDHLKRAPDRFTRTAADFGTESHGIFEALAKGEHVARLADPGLEIMANHFRDFLDTVQPKFLATEDTVWSNEHGYAGSFDALMEINGTPAWGDWKTSKSVYPETALQLSAYAHADFILDGDTGEQHLVPKASHGLVLHVRPEMGWALYELPIGDEVFEVFLHARAIFKWDAVARQVVGKPVLKGAAK